MSIAINYKSNLSGKNSGNLVLFVDEKFNIANIKKYISNSEHTYISDLLKTRESGKKIFAYDLSSKRKIILISINKNITSADAENLGAKLYDLSKNYKKIQFNLISDTISSKLKNFVGYFLHGLRLKSYQFEKYKTKKLNNTISILVSGKNKPSVKDQIKFTAIEQGTFYTRDLVSEPGNILHPDEYAKRINSLKKFGLKINILDEKKLKKLGMNTLLGVGQGSIRGSYLVTIEWNGTKNKCS